MAEFTPAEVEVALELVDEAIAQGDEGREAGYRFLLDVEGPDRPATVRGYVCFGKTPMTEATFDLYWLAVHPDHRRKGVASALVRAMEEELVRDGARLVRVETSGTGGYVEARVFYERLGYEKRCVLEDFYAKGNDLVIYARRLPALY
jgi:ribosomal protein S18 acetylase RimI-like enzyme